MAGDTFFTDLSKAKESEMTQVMALQRSDIECRYRGCVEDLPKTVTQSVLNTYRLLQRELVNMTLRERKLTWCTECESLIPCEQASFLLTEGDEEDTSLPYVIRQDRWDVKRFCNLLRACDSCFGKLIARSPEARREGVRQEPPERFFAYPAELRQDGIFFMEKHGLWLPIPRDASRRFEGDENRIEALAKALGLPMP
jgi:hypothetical protein